MQQTVAQQSCGVSRSRGEVNPDSIPPFVRVPFTILNDMKLNFNVQKRTFLASYVSPPFARLNVGNGKLTESNHQRDRHQFWLSVSVPSLCLQSPYHKTRASLLPPWEKKPDSVEGQRKDSNAPQTARKMHGADLHLANLNHNATTSTNMICKRCRVQ